MPEGESLTSPTFCGHPLTISAGSLKHLHYYLLNIYFQSTFPFLLK